MSKWDWAFAVWGAIAAPGCVLENDDGSDGEADEDLDDDGAADESASHTTAVESGTGDDDDGGGPRVVPECVEPIMDACDALEAHDAECGTMPSEEYSCPTIASWFPQTSACCTALAGYFQCAAAATCDADPDDCSSSGWVDSCDDA